MGDQQLATATGNIESTANVEWETQIHTPLIGPDSPTTQDCHLMPNRHIIVLSACCSSLEVCNILINCNITYHVSQTRSFEIMLNTILSLMPCMMQGASSSSSSLIAIVLQTYHSTRQLYSAPLLPQPWSMHSLFVWNSHNSFVSICWPHSFPNMPMQ